MAVRILTPGDKAATVLCRPPSMKSYHAITILIKSFSTDMPMRLSQGVICQHRGDGFFVLE